MTLTETAALGAMAGLTIYFGLPFARMRVLGSRQRVALAMFAVGVLAFLFVDVLGHAVEIVEASVEGVREGKRGIGDTLLLVGLLAAGFAGGTAGLATIERWLRPSGPTRAPIAGGAVDALTLADGLRLGRETSAARSRALRLGMTIAAAIGLHNFAEGLAIGVSANTGQIGLATILIVGFALHNATEGFGIVGPLGGVRPSWQWLALAGLVAGGPTFLGSVVGYKLTSQPLELAFYAVAGGAVFYIIGEVWNVMRRHGHKELGLWLVATGFITGVVTDLVVVAGGA